VVVDVVLVGVVVVAGVAVNVVAGVAVNVVAVVVAVVVGCLGCFRRRLRNGLHSPDGLSFQAAFRRCELSSICLMMDCIVVVAGKRLLLQR
jgi:hypothetical protein